MVAAGSPVDTVTLGAELARVGQLEAVGGFLALSRLLTKVPTADNVAHYAAIVRDASLVRKLSESAAHVIHRLGMIGDWRAELGSLRSTLDELEAEVIPESKTLGHYVEAEVESIRSGAVEKVGLASGLGLERAAPTGIPLDKVTTIFAESGNFKSTLANNLAWNIAAAGHRVLYVGWEDSARLTAQRFIAQQCGIGYGRLAARNLTDDERQTVQVNQAAIDTASRVIMAEGTEATMDAVIREVRYQRRTKGIDAVVVDYLQIMDYSAKQARHEAMSDAVKAAQRSAYADKVAYILVSQVAADLSDREDPRPRIEDCFGSSAMRMYTKLGIGLFRPWKYCKNPLKGGAYAAYHELAKVWTDGPEDFLKNTYPRLLELRLEKNVIGEAPSVIHALVDLPTGRIEPFNARSHVDLSSLRVQPGPTGATRRRARSKG